MSPKRDALWVYLGTCLLDFLKSMIKKTLKYFWSIRGQFVKYFAVGVSGVVLDITSLILLKEVFGISPVVAVIINQAFLIAYVFFLNKYWSFKNKELPHKQIIKFLTLSLFNYIFSVIAMYIFSTQMEFNYILVRILTIVVMVSWNFFLYKYWV
ncbi:GtrA family protein, partial [Patescibacteria group bacterium]|nr:GtrA family protein [Patescibacteria group bacterium]